MNRRRMVQSFNLNSSYQLSLVLQVPLATDRGDFNQKSSDSQSILTGPFVLESSLIERKAVGKETGPDYQGLF